ncbi:VanZ family protein [Aeoliella mucimassa]|uniref:VanZ like family protein n=1 Tax=Aeoliella mucimassa TaxID=2527972 RepID=A0A518AUJ5_9BACT|nr:VanZ family protein [Aeoliella mucimassa]QDU58396.1 VanZ like family protein [Aeoliella mucimassa]
MAALLFYLLLLTLVTHWPHWEGIPSPPRFEFWDKVVHFTAYAILAYLVSWRWAPDTSERWGSWGIWAALAIISWGVFDELTQPYFNRTCDPYDLLADALGTCTGLAIYQVRHIGTGEKT